MYVFISMYVFVSLLLSTSFFFFFGTGSYTWNLLTGFFCFVLVLFLFFEAQSHCIAMAALEFIRFKHS